METRRKNGMTSLFMKNAGFLKIPNVHKMDDSSLIETNKETLEGSVNKKSELFGRKKAFLFANNTLSSKNQVINILTILFLPE